MKRTRAAATSTAAKRPATKGPAKKRSTATKRGAATKPAAKTPTTKKPAAKRASSATSSSRARTTTATTARAPKRATAKPVRGAAQRWTAPAFLRAGALRGDGELEVGGRRVALSSVDRVYFPRPGYTKADLLRYYLAVGDVIMPYLEGRPAILKRHPRGAAGPSFFQHDMPSPPEGVRTAELHSEAGRLLHYAVYSDTAAMLALVNLGTVAHNPWHARVEDLAHPDYVVFDLDPQPDAPFEHVLTSALLVRDVLHDEAGLAGLVKTSGSRGLHVYVPIRAEYTFEQAADFSEAIAARIAARRPDIATVERALAARKPRQVYVDWQQNAIGKSAASVYSARAKPDATVSAPVTWDEVERGAIALTDFTIATMPARLEARGDLWSTLFTARQALPPTPR